MIGKNLHFGKNELDIVAINSQYLVFAEVKTRTLEGGSCDAQIRPSLAVDSTKRQRTVDAARAYLAKKHTDRCPRFDVIEVYLDRSKRYRALKINHIEDAFTASGKFRR